MNTKQLKYVLTLANEGSFSRAADALGISQPSLSQYIKKIEQEQGVALFDRTGGLVRLTDAGQIYIEAGRSILDIEHRMENALSDLGEHKSGSLVVGTAPYRSVAVMPRIAAAFKRRYPGVCLVVAERGSNELIEGIERGEFDLCLLPNPPASKLFTVTDVMEEELVLAVPRRLRDRFTPSPMAGRKHPAIDIKAVDGMPFVMITETQIMQMTLDRLCREHDLTLQKEVVVKSLEAQIAMVAAGVGLALVPDGVERFATEDVAYFSIKQPLPKRRIVALHRSDRPLSVVARDLIELMKQSNGDL